MPAAPTRFLPCLPDHFEAVSFADGCGRNQLNTTHARYSATGPATSSTSRADVFLTSERVALTPSPLGPPPLRPPLTSWCFSLVISVRRLPMRFTYSEMWWFTSRELRVALVLMFLARLAYLSVLSVSSNDDEAPLLSVAWREAE